MPQFPIFSKMKWFWSGTSGKTIAILMHEQDRNADRFQWAISYLAEVWEEDGHRVRYVFGVNKFVPADLAILHVDLSVVPDEYIKFGRQYPVTLNGEIKDIRKSVISQNLVRPGDQYAGPVIIKSDLNYGGFPERRLAGKLAEASQTGIDSPMDYQILENLQAVPEAAWNSPDLVVEKFLPEMDGAFYCIRNYIFLGDQANCTRRFSRRPIVNSQTQTRSEDIEPHPEIVGLRRKLGFDYGKFDYVIHNGQPILLDANKTTGAATRSKKSPVQAHRRMRARGLYEFFERRTNSAN